MSNSPNDHFANIPDPQPISEMGTHVEQSIRNAVTTEVAPTRGAVIRRRRLALGATAAWALLYLVTLGIRPELSSLALWYAGALLALPIALCWLTLAVAARMGDDSLGLRVQVAAPVALLVPAGFLALALVLPMPHDTQVVSALWPGALRCFELTLVGAAPPLLFAAIAFRRSFPASARYRGALLGAACGLLASSVMNLHCPVLDPMHLVIGHVVPVVLVILLCALTGFRSLRA